MNDARKQPADDANLYLGQISSDLIADRELRREAWGDLDDLTLARYLAGEATEAEAGRVCLAMDMYPMVRECLTIVREVASENLIAKTERIVKPIPARKTTISFAKLAERFLPEWRIQIPGSAVEARLLLVVMTVLLVVVVVRFGEVNGGRRDHELADNRANDRTVITDSPAGPVRTGTLPATDADIVRNSPSGRRLIVANARENGVPRTAIDSRDVAVGEVKNTAEPPVSHSKTREADAISASAEVVLGSRGLTRDGVCYVVATEAEISKAYQQIVPIYNVMEAAFNQFQVIVGIEANVQSLDDQRIILETRINEIGIELGRIAGSRLPEDQVYRTQLNNELPLRKEALNTTNHLAASRELQPIVKRASAEYKKLDQDTAVKDALRAIENDTNSPVKLRPSKALTNAIGRLTRAERWLVIDKSVYRRGTKKKSKAK